MRWMKALFLTAGIALAVPAVPLTVNETVDITHGAQPSCAIDTAGTLHVVYKMNGVKYTKIAPDGTMGPEEVLASQGENPFIVVDVKAGIHVVWDNGTYGTQCHYRGKTAGGWGEVIALPRPRSGRHFYPQVAADKDGMAFWSLWAADTDKQNASYFGTIQNGAAKLHPYSKGENRPPSILGPMAHESGDNKVRAFPGSQQLTYLEMTASSQGTAAGIGYTGKMAEGHHVAWIDGGFAVAFGNCGSSPEDILLYLSTWGNGAAVIVADDGSCHDAFPRTAYDAANKLVYVIWAGSRCVAYDVTAKKVIAGPATLPGGQNDVGRGHGAGGIATAPQGGVYVVKSNSQSLLQRLHIGDGSGVVSTVGRTHPPRAQPATSRVVLPGFRARRNVGELYDLRGRPLGRIPAHGVVLRSQSR